MIQFDQIGKSYGTVRALDDVSMTVETGQILGLLGPNGAGKTTAMKIITCYMPPTSGRVTVDGIDVVEDPLAVRRKVGYLPEHNPLYLDMGVSDYLRFCGRLHGLEAAALPVAIDRAIERCGLKEYRNRFIGQLSKGYRQRVGLAQAIIHDPQVLILDEPTTGLDPNQIIEIRKLIRDIGAEKTVILSTHIMQEVQATCSRMVIINRGRIVADDTPEQLRARMTGAGSHILEVQGHPEGAARLLNERLPLREVIDHSAPGGDTSRFELHGDPGDDLRERLFRFCVEQDWTLLELARSQTSLEDVFRQLTAEDGKEAA